MPLLKNRNSNDFRSLPKKAYEFSTSTEPQEEWWWHLDKAASGELEVEIGPTTKSSD